MVLTGNPLVQRDSRLRGNDCETLNASYRIRISFPENHFCDSRMRGNDRRFRINGNPVLDSNDEWSKKGVWSKIFKALQIDVDEDGSMVDASVIRAHQHAAGGKGGPRAMLWDALEEVFPRKSTLS